MLFEPCSSHEQQTSNILLPSIHGLTLQCSKCLQDSIQNRSFSGVILTEKTISFFFKWNKYLIEELTHLTQIVSNEGYGFIFKEIMPSPQMMNDSFLNQRILKQTTVLEINSHKQLLQKNLKILKAENLESLKRNSIFLKDFYILATQPVVSAIDSIRIRIQDRISKLLNTNVQLLWKDNILECLEQTRKIIVSDWIGNDKFIMFNIKGGSAEWGYSNSKSDKDTTEIESTCSQFRYSNLRYNDINQSEFQSQSLKDSNRTLNSDSSSDALQELIDKNEELKVELEKSQQQQQRLRIELNRANRQMLQEIEREQNKYQDLNSAHLQICTKVETLEQALKQVEKQFVDFVTFIEQQKQDLKNVEYERVLTENKEISKQLEKVSQELIEKGVQNRRQKRELEEKLLEEVVEIQSGAMQKETDITKLIECLIVVLEGAKDSLEDTKYQALINQVQKKSWLIERRFTHKLPKK